MQFCKSIQTIQKKNDPAVHGVRWKGRMQTAPLGIPFETGCFIDAWTNFTGSF